MSPSATGAEYDVAIVCEGPVGATLALPLADAALCVSIVERSPAVVVRPDRFIYGVVDGCWSLGALRADLATKTSLVR